MKGGGQPSVGQPSSPLAWMQGLWTPEVVVPTTSGSQSGLWIPRQCAPVSGSEAPQVVDGGSTVTLATPQGTWHPGAQALKYSPTRV